jgi:hypothetical protein
LEKKKETCPLLCLPAEQEDGGDVAFQHVQVSILTLDHIPNTNGERSSPRNILIFTNMQWEMFKNVFLTCDVISFLQ